MSSLTMWNQSRLRKARLRGLERMGAVLLQPGVDVEVVVLLAPEHAGERLAHDVGRIR